MKTIYGIHSVLLCENDAIEWRKGKQQGKERLNEHMFLINASSFHITNNGNHTGSCYGSMSMCVCVCER